MPDTRIHQWNTGACDSILQRMMDWRQVWNKDLETHRQKLPWSSTDQNNVNVNEENKLCQIMTKKNKQIVL
jgi:hypothetical protein